MNRLLDWLCARLGLCIDFSGDLMTPDWSDGDGDPHYRRVHVITPRQHAAHLRQRRTR